MNRDRFLRLSQAEARDLKDLVEAELERRFLAIKEKLERYWTLVVGYDAEQSWSELRELIQDLVKSNLASLDKSLAILLEAPPGQIPLVEVPPVEVPELKPEDKPAEQEEKPEDKPAEQEEKPEEQEEKTSSRRSR